MIRPCRDDDRAAIVAIVNAAADAYRDVIPADRWRVPYMPAAELDAEIAAGVVFWGYERDGELVRRHVRLTPAIRGDDAAVGLGGGVDDRKDRVVLVVAAAADHR